jgi:hypothetical protein
MSQNGALTQLVAVGAQENNFLSKDPKDSLFKEPTKKVNNFVKETHSMYPTGTANWGTTTRFKIDKRGDLLNSLYFVAKLPKLDRSFLEDNSDADGGDGWKLNYVRWVNYIGNVLIKKVRLYIGGDLIDEQSGEFMQVYTDIQDDDWNKLCLIGMDSELNRPVETLNPRFVYVPLKFWFCANIKKALPIIAIRHQDIEVEVDIRNWDECYQVLKLVKFGDQFVQDPDELNAIAKPALGTAITTGKMVVSLATADITSNDLLKTTNHTRGAGVNFPATNPVNPKRMIYSFLKSDFSNVDNLTVGTKVILRTFDAEGASYGGKRDPAQITTEIIAIHIGAQTGTNSLTNANNFHLVFKDDLTDGNITTTTPSLKITNFMDIRSRIYDYGHIDFVNIQRENKMSEQPLEGIRLDCNFSYVDDKERRHLVEQEYKILITQTQSIKTNILSHTIDLDFNHPVKELFWFYSNKTVRETPDPFNFCNVQENPDLDVSQGFIKDQGWGSYNYVAKNMRLHWMDEARILVNGKELIGWNNWKYYYYVQNYEHYRNKLEHFVYLYSFSTSPKGLTPAGSLNFSRVDNAQLQFKMNKKTQITFNGLRERSTGDTTRHYMTDDNQFDIHIYAVNYNYLIIKNGMAGLAYKT